MTTRRPQSPWRWRLRADAVTRLIVGQRRRWCDAKGKPVISRIADDAQIGVMTLSRVVRRVTAYPANDTMAALVHLYATTHDVEPETAQSRLFELVYVAERDAYGRQEDAA